MSTKAGQLQKAVKCDSFDDEIDAIAAYIEGLIDTAGEDVENPLASVCQSLHAVHRGDAQPFLPVEFDRVIVAGVNDGVVPLRIAIMSSDDEAVREEAETRERALLYVAVTRARNEALVTSNGRPSPLLGSV